MKLDTNIWGPRYWFFLHTAAMAYPSTPNATIKKKFYEFIQNFPLFIPDERISASFSELLDAFPVSPYLDSKDSLIRWTHFIHNKVNKKLEKEEISMSRFYGEYYEQYDTSSDIQVANVKMKRVGVYAVVLILIIIAISRLYNK